MFRKRRNQSGKRSQHSRLNTQSPGMSDLLSQVLADLDGEELAAHIRELEASLKADPDDMDTRAMLFLRYSQAERLEDAAEMLESMLARMPDNGFMTAQLGHFYLNRLDQPERALPVYEEALKLGGDAVLPDIGWEMGYLYRLNADWEEAIGIYRRLTRLMPDSMEAHGLLAEVYAITERWQEALTYGERALALNGKDAHLHVILGAARAGLEQHEQAEELYKKALTLDAESFDAHVKLLELYLETEQYQKAIALGKKALRRFPENVDVLMLLGTAYLDTERGVEAVPLLETAARLVPDDIEILTNLGMAYTSDGKTARMADIAERIIDIDPEDSRGHELRGQACLLQGRVREAISASEKAVALDPNGEMALFTLVLSYAAEGKQLDAERAFKRLRALNAEMAEELVEMGMIEPPPGPRWRR